MHRFASLTLLVVAAVSSIHASVRSWESEWQAFRAAYPCHVQVIALSKANIEGKRLLIISEPPPGLKPKDIAQLVPESFGQMALPRHGIGYDGWAQDAAIELKPQSDQQLAPRIDSLHAKIFGT